MIDPTFSLIAQNHGLEALVAKIRGLMLASKSTATRDAYSSDFKVFRDWAVAHQLPFLPSNPPTVALFIGDAAGSSAVSTIARRLVSINQAHHAAGYQDSPASTRNPLVGATLKGIRRTLASPVKTKAPLMADGIRALVAACPTTLLGLRDRALLLLGWATGMRCDSLAMLDVSDITDRGDGIGVVLRRSKTDQEGIGRIIHVAFASHAETCPVLAVRAWISASGVEREGGFLFRGVDRWNRVSSTGLNPDSISRIIRRAVVRAGLPNPSDFGGRSLRSGLVTQGAISRVSPFEIMEVTGHKSLAVLRLYARLGYLKRGVGASELGL